MATVEKVKLGATGPAVFPVALGCMGMSGMYGPSDDEESVATAWPSRSSRETSPAR
jgi:aryl-alcohol dehydrogenase-like predicted oxidoreductase